jgi:hypothetical protein
LNFFNFVVQNVFLELDYKKEMLVLWIEQVHYFLLLILFVVPAGTPAYRTSAFEAVCTLTSVLVPRSSPEALHAIRRKRPLLAKG